MNNFYFILFLILFNFFVFVINIKKIISLVNIYDYPDKNRKKHLKRTPVIGGLIFYSNFFIVFIFSLIEQDYQNFFFSSTKELAIVMFSMSIFFLLGLYDDKFDIKPTIKFIISCIVLFFYTYFLDDTAVTFLKFKTFNGIYTLGYFSLFFTLMCILLFQNAFNMFDGSDLQIGNYVIIIIIILMFKTSMFFFFSCLLIPSIFFWYLNNKRIIFMGNSGTLLLPFIFSYFFIKSYSLNNFFIYVEDILIIMIIPGLDILRVFIFRILSNRNPFFPDRSHLHHLLEKKFNENFTIQLIIVGLIIFPLIANIFINNFYYVLIFTISIYLTACVFCLRNK
jgi:UDP-GlcNAc:undecaprenyl-phosphate GlcNAc-1-phosphate transferase